MRRRIAQGVEVEKTASYSRAVVDGDMIFVSGTTGFDHATRTIPDDVVEQAENCFRIIDWALGEAGASLSDVVRVRLFFTDAADFERVVPLIRERFKDVLPANTTVVSPLIDPRAKIEIEVTAKKSRG